MFNIEKRLINYLEKYLIYYFLFFISVCGLVIRYLGRGFISGDMRNFLVPWWNKIAELGPDAVSTQVGNYNIPYQFLIYLMQNISPFSTISSYKILSCIFDYVLAIACGLLAIELKKENKKIIFSLVYSVVLLFPTIFLNSAIWGQCDSIYCSFIILSILFLVKKRFSLSFILLGLALAFKLQTIFIFPLFGFYYFRNKEFSIVKIFSLMLLSMYIACSPGLLLGRSLFEPIKIYISQSNYEYLWANFPSFWSLIALSDIGTHSLFKTIGVILAASILGIGLFFATYKKIKINHSNIILIAIWTVYTCLLFLPNMHDRYAYLLDLLFIMIIFLNKRFGIFSIIPILSSILVYANYLFLNVTVSVNIIAIFYVINYTLFSYFLVKYLFINNQKTNIIFEN